MNDHWTRRLLAFFAAGLLATACGEGAHQADDASTPGGHVGDPSGATSSDGGGATSSDGGGGTSSDAGGRKSGDAGVPSSKGDASMGKDKCPAPPPNVVGGKYFTSCGYVCKTGFADCDGQSENGCEVDLSAPNACASCGPAACLNPGLCGLDAPVCQRHKGQQWLLRPDSQSDLGRLGEFGFVAAGPKPRQVFATINVPLDKTVPKTELKPYSSTFEVSLDPANTTAVWSADGRGLETSRLWRYGDRLYSFSTANPVLDPAGALYVSTLAGEPVWTKVVKVAGASVCPAAVAADEGGNVHFGLRICDGEAVINGKKYDGLMSGVEMLIVAYDPAGNERWRAVPHDSSRGACWLGAQSVIHSMLAVGGKLLQTNAACLMEVDTATGAALQDHPLYVRGGFGAVEADAAGNLYVCGVAADYLKLFAGNAADTWNEKDWFGLPDRAFVSKYTPSFEHVWTRPVAVQYGAEIIGFDVSRTGTGQLVGRWSKSDAAYTYFVFDFDVDGRTLGAEILAKQWRPTSLSMDDQGTPYLGGDMKGDPMLGNGMFIWEFPLTPQ